MPPRLADDVDCGTGFPPGALALQKRKAPDFLPPEVGRFFVACAIMGLSSGVYLANAIAETAAISGWHLRDTTLV